MRDKLQECCGKRGDAWGSEVQNCLHGCIDLVAAEAIYHVNCYSQFLLKVRIYPFTRENCSLKLTWQPAAS